jgi:ComF family protein
MARLAAIRSRLQTRWVAPTRVSARRALDAGLDLVFPPACGFCDAPLDGTPRGAALCCECRELLLDTRAYCPRCAASASPVARVAACVDCRDARLHFEQATRLGVYDGPLRTAVLRIKRPAERGLAVALGEWAAATLEERLVAWNPDAVVPIPMHWTRRMWRGANSAETLAERLAARLRIPMAAHILTRRRRTVPQASLAPGRRRANVRGAFRVRRNRDLPGSRLLVVDDIMTTGATVNEAAKTLVRAGAAAIHVVVLTRAPGLG